MKGAWPIDHGVKSELVPVLPRLFICPWLFSGSTAILFPGLPLCSGLLVTLLTLSISGIRLVRLNSRNLADLVIPVCRSVMVPLVSEVLASLPSRGSGTVVPGIWCRFLMCRRLGRVTESVAVSDPDGFS